MDIQVILGQMLVLFAMMVIGYFLSKRKWLDDAVYQKLSRIVVNVFNPLLVVYGAAGKTSGNNRELLLQNFGFVVFYYLFLIFASYMINLFLRPEKKNRNLYRLMTIFSNVGFIGIPVISSVYGTEAIIYVVFYMLIYNLLIYTYGVVLARKAAVYAGNLPAEETNKKKGEWRRMINPGVIAAVFAIVIFLFQIDLPDPVITFSDYMGNSTVPLSMILIGVSIAKVDLKKIFSNIKMYLFILIRMVIIPIVLVLILRSFEWDSMVFGVFALQIAMPVGSITTLISKENGADETCCTDGIVLSTLLSIFTIPVVCLFL